MGSAAVPLGASKGSHEETEVRDGDEGRYDELGVLKVVDFIFCKGGLTGCIFLSLLISFTRNHKIKTASSPGITPTRPCLS